VALPARSSFGILRHQLVRRTGGLSGHFAGDGDADGGERLWRHAVSELAVDAQLHDARVKLLRSSEPQPGRSMGLA
jgi:hypothetical protein